MLETQEEFKAKVADIQSQSWYKNPIGFGIARVDRGQLNSDKILQATYPVVNWNENFGSAAIFMDALKESGVEFDTSKSEVVLDITDEFISNCIKSFNPYIEEAEGDAHKNVQLVVLILEMLKDLDTLEAKAEKNDTDNQITVDEVYELEYLREYMENLKIVFIFENVKSLSVESSYLKLNALSTGKTPIRSLDLNGIFGQLHNVAWEGNNPIELDWLRANELTLKLTGKYPNIDAVDKFPRYLQHIIPADNTRILDTAKVRFGAQLAAGTTVMPGASYINFNAGTEGSVMVEGRISSSAVVGAGSDVGGGASILGVLSGTDGVPVSIGENTLLGANSCTGTAIGDSCILDAGVTILPGTKITLSEKAVAAIAEANPEKEISVLMKGMDFQGVNGVHFRQNSINGQIIAMRSTREVKLNADLH